MDVDAFMRQIRAEIAKRGPDASTTDRRGHQNVAADGLRSKYEDPHVLELPRLSAVAPPIARMDRYVLGDFLNYHDEAFIQNAYRGLLRREPDAEGSRGFLNSLRLGDLAKVEILGRIRYSSEGRAAGVAVDGLHVPFALRTLRRVPVLGYLFGIAQYILRLPHIVRNHERLEAVVFMQHTHLRRDIDHVNVQIEQAVRSLRELMLGSIAATQEKLDAIESSVATADHAIEAARLSATARLDALANSLNGGLASKVGRPDLDMVERDLRSDIDRHNVLASERFATLGARFDAEAGTRSSQLDLVAKNADAKIEALRLLVDGLEKWAEDLPPSLLLRQNIGVVEEVKANATRLAGEFEIVRSQALNLDARFVTMDQRLLQSRQSLLEQERRLSMLLERSRDTARQTMHSSDHIAAGEVLDHLYDGFYVAFEDRFRGTREDIKQRVEIYVPYVRAATAKSGGLPVLDIGCGRGEWLELLRENDIAASGIDLNHVTASQCRARGLAVVEAGAIDYLRNMEDASVGAVTAIHVIEHLSFRDMMLLFDEVRRVLHPSGIAIFETPNPENLVVGACNFWYDPTHQRPLPPEPTRFILENRGFARVELLRIHPTSDFAAINNETNAVEASFASRLSGPQDYAVIGYKS